MKKLYIILCAMLMFVFMTTQVQAYDDKIMFTPEDRTGIGLLELGTFDINGVWNKYPEIVEMNMWPYNNRLSEAEDDVWSANLIEIIQRN